MTWLRKSQVHLRLQWVVVHFRLEERIKEVNLVEWTLGVVTLIPKLQWNQRWQRFILAPFREKVQTAHEALQIKAKRCTEAVPDNAPILYEYGAFGKRLNAEDNVNDLFKMVVVLFLRLYRLIWSRYRFYGPNWEHNEEAHQFTINIVKELMTTALSGKEDPNHYHWQCLLNSKWKFNW